MKKLAYAIANTLTQSPGEDETPSWDWQTLMLGMRPC